MDDPDHEATVDRLILENRQLHRTLDSIQAAIFVYTDLNKLSLSGAITYLVRHRKLLDEIKHRLKKAQRKPELSNEVLCEIEALLESME